MIGHHAGISADNLFIGNALAHIHLGEDGEPAPASDLVPIVRIRGISHDGVAAYGNIGILHDGFTVVDEVAGHIGGGCVEPEHIVLLIPQQIQHTVILVDAPLLRNIPDRSVFQMGII